MPPAPPELREMSTDRPDTTESPFTVDAGHFQFELEIAAWERSGRHTTLNLGELNLKAGMTSSTDLQLVLPLYSRTQHSDGPEGFGDVTVRLKHNLWGNDGGPTAFGIMPFLKIPTARSGLGNGAVEGGLILPFSFSLPGNWDAAVMSEIDFAADDEGDHHHAVFVTSFTTSHAITENTAGFMELVSVLDTRSGSGAQAYFNTGLTWKPSARWQLDGGLRTGLTADSADFTPFLGCSAKF
ncbi:MAG: hypothetical protein JWL81_1868 [Verrucomicrobiales bacterium]|nr:hypothetical protein [Verrucomicrobiales bacterium]